MHEVTQTETSLTAVDAQIQTSRCLFKRIAHGSVDMKRPKRQKKTKKNSCMVRPLPLPFGSGDKRVSPNSKKISTGESIGTSRVSSSSKSKPLSYRAHVQRRREWLQKYLNKEQQHKVIHDSKILETKIQTQEKPSLKKLSPAGIFYKKRSPV